LDGGLHEDAHASPSSLDDALETKQAALAEDWAGMTAEGRPTWEELWELGRRAGVGMGKWVITLPRDKVDAIWASVAPAVGQGVLGPLAQVRAPIRASEWAVSGA
jgi:hypothetical protein